MAHDKTSKYPPDYRSERFVAHSELEKFSATKQKATAGSSTPLRSGRNDSLHWRKEVLADGYPIVVHPPLARSSATPGDDDLMRCAAYCATALKIQMRAHGLRPIISTLPT
jgi:hypothetical protein